MLITQKNTIYGNFFHHISVVFIDMRKKQKKSFIAEYLKAAGAMSRKNDIDGKIVAFKCNAHVNKKKYSRKVKHSKKELFN